MKRSTMDAMLTLTCPVQFLRGEHGQLEMWKRTQPGRAPRTGRVPRVSRLMALAIRFEDLMGRGEANDYAELARVGRVTRARVGQIMILLNLAADIQEKLLTLPPVELGHDPINEWQIHPIAAEPLWSKQRRLFRKLSH